jgi:hypothetical protein
MTIYTDGVHLWAPDRSHLVRFADAIGLRREWLQPQTSPLGAFHFDIIGDRTRRKALKAGATLVSRRKLVELIREARNA